MQKLYASIDIGTNSVLLLIASLEEGRLVPRLEKIAEPRIGRDLASSGSIGEEQLHGLLDCLLDFRRTIVRVGAVLVEAAGTQALRKAGNRKEVLQRISRLLRHPCRILSGEEESEISLRALMHQYPKKQIAVVDIGGGSSEIAVKDKRLTFPVGAVSMFEEHGVLAANNREKAGEVLHSLPKIGVRTELMAIGGTPTTMAMIQLGLSRYEMSAIEGAVLKKKEISRWIDILADYSEGERGQIVGLAPSRRDIIIPGLCLMEAVMAAWGREEITVSTIGLRHGLILGTIFQP